ncbi:hypothetical protein O9H85_35965 [Paenibacillus filicis]|uniref:DUF2007 domain-containing protein n=1 Tax=Paenibacillus gyeongsangnamensis TaxID=3388067 RepID=A0ABT4QL78_9BACL|nr:hypothetical protein [Paenibacillus filicis]MCZ8517628.1 hypothetical protein [Paenibacillus filicis]
MENITALFRTRGDMEQAAAVLREQGAVDIAMYGAPVNAEGAGAATASTRDAAACTLQVVVESSRFRQAEDTIMKYGGHV